MGPVHPHCALGNFASVVGDAHLVRWTCSRLPNEGIWATLMLITAMLVLIVAPATQNKQTLQSALSIGADGMRSGSPTIAKDLNSGWRVALMRDFSSSSSNRAGDSSFGYASDTVQWV